MTTSNSSRGPEAHVAGKPIHDRPPRRDDTATALGQADRDDLVDSAWDLVTQALETGFFELKSGIVITLTPDQLVRHMQWVAGLGKRKPKSTPALKDFFLRQTRKDPLPPAE